jgi:hypothetical protein
LIATRGSDGPDSIQRRTWPTVTECVTAGGRTRRIWLPEINGGNGPRRSAADRQAINAPMQGTAADLIKLAMIAVQAALDAGARATKMVLQVHAETRLGEGRDLAHDGRRRRTARAAARRGRRRPQLDKAH